MKNFIALQSSRSYENFTQAPHLRVQWPNFSDIFMCICLYIPYTLQGATTKFKLHQYFYARFGTKLSNLKIVNISSYMVCSAISAACQAILSSVRACLPHLVITSS